MASAPLSQSCFHLHGTLPPQGSALRGSREGGRALLPRPSCCLRIWGSSATQYSPNQDSHDGFASKPLLKHKLRLIEKVEDLSNTFSSTFLTAGEGGSLAIDHHMAPQLAEAVTQSLGDALAQQQVH